MVLKHTYGLVLLLALASCIAPGARQLQQVTAFRDPTFAGVRFKRLGVFVDTPDLKWRTELERLVATALRQRGMDAYESYTVIMPTREWTGGDISDTLARHSIDAYLRFSLLSSMTKHAVTPVSTTTTMTRETRPKSETRTEKTTEKVETTTTGGEEYTWMQKRYRIELVATSGMRIAWVGTHDLGGESNNDCEWFAREIAAQLDHDAVAVVLPPATRP